MVDVESDEAFARRLQAQELGIRQADIQTPLMLDQHARNPTVIHARLNEANTARATIVIIFIFHAPQILATAIVLAQHWGDNSICDGDHRMKWNYWSLMSAIRMFLYTSIVILMYFYRSYLETNAVALIRATNIRNVMDALGLIWFVIGNMWLFGDDSSGCSNPGQSPVYQLCVAMLVLNYIQICLPCIVAVLMVPVFCFCMPCLIRILARMQDPVASKGATDDAIATLPVTVISADTFAAPPDGSEQDATCPICLSEMSVGQEARLLACKHIFHKQCVDEWLRVNASCPTCRTGMFGNTETEGNGTGGAEGGGGGQSTTQPPGSSQGPSHSDEAKNDIEVVSLSGDSRSSSGRRVVPTP
mmetsp:Transcript_19251/g.19386  ORF Transcript_19251/g.19386 Transcript_19251/m.19386 type:complete len:360 (+) Transcript_19251:104-1183(+)|eukprot:CAMPEP_0182420748 /NCGR_PEP_ID=MMETSP1167-20130531/5789_1 /TAXON_ID=2988 /ORGANISM="Mallomonas Sp, Strain CCMP3275" /LENGTH=359 /DNA_ID=CAMNT_0024597147 /DNA_START=61 /DNA_END=1140 /DNA_ORIENTATION=+